MNEKRTRKRRNRLRLFIPRGELCLSCPLEVRAALAHCIDIYLRRGTSSSHTTLVLSLLFTILITNEVCLFLCIKNKKGQPCIEQANNLLFRFISSVISVGVQYFKLALYLSTAVRWCLASLYFLFTRSLTLFISLVLRLPRRRLKRSRIMRTAWRPLRDSHAPLSIFLVFFFFLQHCLTVSRFIPSNPHPNANFTLNLHADRRLLVYGITFVARIVLLFPARNLEAEIIIFR